MFKYIGAKFETCYYQKLETPYASDNVNCTDSTRAMVENPSATSCFCQPGVDEIAACVTADVCLGSFENLGAGAFLKFLNTLKAPYIFYNGERITDYFFKKTGYDKPVMIFVETMQKCVIMYPVFQPDRELYVQCKKTDSRWSVGFVSAKIGHCPEGTRVAGAFLIDIKSAYTLDDAMKIYEDRKKNVDISIEDFNCFAPDSLKKLAFADRM